MGDKGRTNAVGYLQRGFVRKLFLHEEPEKSICSVQYYKLCTCIYFLSFVLTYLVNICTVGPFNLKNGDITSLLGITQNKQGTNQFYSENGES